MKHEFKSFAILGGDKRQLYLADSLVREGYTALLGGFDRLRSLGGIELTSIPDALNRCDAVLLPLPSLRTDGSLNAPFAQSPIYFDDETIEYLRGKPLFVSQQERLFRTYPQLREAQVYDYAARDDFAILNAVPSAEGAIACAISAYEGTLFCAKVMVVGFGRIGKLLSRLLHAMNADVTVTARRQSDSAYIKALGYSFLNTEKLGEVSGYDIVFNTVPHLIFDRGLLMRTDRKTLFIDLASLPGGVDFEAATELGIDAQRALGLPGKYAPKTAGEIIKTTVFNIIEEVNW